MPMEKLFVKNRYYPGKLLHASDFVREQEYGNAKLEFLNRKFHGWGIIQGLEVRAGEGNTLHVTAGSAIDQRGRLILVPEDFTAGAETLEGLGKAQEIKQDHHRAPAQNYPEEVMREVIRDNIQDRILGIRYDEKPVDRERSLLSEKETVEVARIAESYTLKAYSVEEWERLRGAGEVSLTEERVLYEDGEVRLSLRIPKVVPADSIFRIRIQASALAGGNVSIGWRCTAKLQGAFFLASGRSLQIMEEQQTILSGSLYQEWQICTEEYRKQVIAMELSRLEILRQGMETVEAEACQTYIETASAYEEAVRKHLRRREEREAGEAWVPLARIRLGGARSGTQGGVRIGTQGRAGDGAGDFVQDIIFVAENEPGLRRRVVQSEETELIRREAEESGIIDIRWRGLLKTLRSAGAGQPVSPPELPSERAQPPERAADRPPEKAPGGLPEKAIEPPPGVRWEQVHRGVAVIPVPKRYRKGDTLFSEEISHGFPGEEVFLWLERLYEEPSYAYWEKNSTRHTAVHGTEELFADGWYSGWEIQKQALRQEIEAGTFQIALILTRGRRKRRSREVALSWTAVRLQGPGNPAWPGFPTPAADQARAEKSF